MSRKKKAFQICDQVVQPGERVTFALPAPELYSCAQTYLPIQVIHGAEEGPCLALFATMHGDEVNGVAIIQRLFEMKALDKLKGTVIAVPVLNPYGLLSQSRNLPDRRDLDGSFPGSKTGSYTARLAHLINQEVLSHATHCIDLHSGEPQYSRLSQVQTDTKNSDALTLAHAFGAPIILHNETKRGMLWQMQEGGTPTLIYETGEGYRLDETGISVGVEGILRVMGHLEMIPTLYKQVEPPPIITSTDWVRSPTSGLSVSSKKLGMHVKKGESVAELFDPFGAGQKMSVKSPKDGLIIGTNHNPLVGEGDYVLAIGST